MNIQTVKNVSDCVPLYLPHSLYLKPHAKMVISVQMPTAVTGKTISNWDVMENLRNMISPDKFSVLKATKSTLELIRFDAELEERERLKSVLARLDGSTIKLSGFSESARVRASEAKDTFPKRHDWDSYFRDARNMDEKKSGERPDTIHISNLPIRWFCPRHMENDDDVKPSESIFKRIFEKFGAVRVVDIPICDPYRKEMKSHMTGMKTFSFDQELYFEGYVQFHEYIGFVRTMDALRGMKLLHKEGDKNLAISIAVDFDTTKHLNEANIKRRQIIRDRLIMRENEKREEERRRTEEEEKKKEQERQRLENLKIEEYEKQRQREEKRKEKYLKKLREQEQQQLSSKIRSEEKKLLIAQRKLESIRVLEALFDRIKLKNDTLKLKIKKEYEGGNSKKNDATSSSLHKNKKFDLRDKLISKVKSVQEQELERQKNRLKKYKTGITLDKVNQMDRSSKERSPSINSISSDDIDLIDEPMKRKKKKRNESEASDAEIEKHEDHGSMLPGIGAYPMYHPETGAWLGMYPYPAPFFQPIYPPSTMPYNNYRGAPSNNYRGRFPRSRGRGSYRGRANYYSSHDDRRNDDSYDHKRRHRRRSDSSRSRSRSYSRSRSRSRSRSYSRNRRSRRSTSKTRSKLQEEHKSKKLASTLRRSHSSSTSSRSSRSHSPSLRKRSRSRHSHSRRSSGKDRKSRSRSRRRSESKSKRSISSNGSKSRRRTSRSLSKTRKQSISHTPPQEHSSRRKDRSQSKSRSKSIDSSGFQSPKRKAQSVTPEKEWD